ncbi:MAG: ComEC/Rec2 family competence protein [Steroidobacteraceae bacterium]|nr:ComEC/Rec2 family competence protein [Steroidobacteraceae bacterium]
MALLVAAVAAVLCAAASRPVLACLLAGFVASGAVAHRQVALRWPAALAGERVVVEGRVDGLPRGDGAQVRFDLEGAIVAPASLARPVRLRATARDPAVRPRAGERWRLLLRLEPPRAAANPGGPDAERLLFIERIDALATVVPSRLGARLAAAGPGLDGLRAAIGERIRESVADRDAAALIAGLAIGASADISREQWRVFGATGTVHLVAISGLHVTLFAWLATLGARRAWRVLRLGSRVEREPFAACFGIAAAAAYALLAGFGIPAQRTLVMLVTWWAARLGGRRAGGIEVVGLALLVVLALDPLAPLSAGFWLSFAAIAVLIAAGAEDAARPGVVPRAARSDRHWATIPTRLAAAAIELLRTQWRITLALAPATLVLFGTVPLAGLLANLVAIPFFSALLVPLILAALAALPWSPGLAASGWQLAERLYLAAWPGLEAFAALPASDWLRTPPPGWLPVALLALPWCALPVPTALRATALAAVLPLLGPAQAPPERGSFRALLLETGDGTALVLMTRAHTVVYDTGDVYGSAGARASQAVLPALRAHGRHRVDLLVQSRAVGFRVAGVAALLDGVEVRELRSGGSWNGAPRPGVACDSETGWIWDDVEFRVFPAAPTHGRVGGGGGGTGGEGSVASCVLRVAAARGRGAALLLAGQLDAAEALQAGGAAGASRWRADTVLAPRRGSTRVPAATLAAAIAPRQLLVASRDLSPGRRAALARAWGIAPAEVRATALEGALVVEVAADRERLEVGRWLDAQPRRHWRVPRE